VSFRNLRKTKYEKRIKRKSKLLKDEIRERRRKNKKKVNSKPWKTANHSLLKTEQIRRMMGYIVKMRRRVCRLIVFKRGMKIGNTR
jgi:predicted ATP-dependent Lon-type protease